MFSPLPEQTCSEWVRVNIDPAAAKLRDDDNVFRAEVGSFEHTGEEALQKRLLGALQLRALRAQPFRGEIKLNRAGSPNEALSQLWLEFVKSETVVISAQKPKTLPTMNVVPPDGCWPTKKDQHPCATSDPAKEAQHQRAIERNTELVKQWNHFSKLEDTASSSIADFGMWLGPLYQGNNEARANLYAEAKAMGMPNEQVSELRRFLEFANSSE